MGPSNAIAMDRGGVVSHTKHISTPCGNIREVGIDIYIPTYMNTHVRTYVDIHA